MAEEINENEKKDMTLMTVEEASAYLHFSRAYIYRLARANILPHVNYGRHLLFRKVDLFEWVGSMVTGSNTASFAVNK